VLHHDEQAVVTAVELALESAAPSVNVARIFLKTIEVKFPSLWVR